MPVADPAAVFLPGLEAAGVEYMVSGGVGAIVYGEPRMTNDIDLVLSLAPDDASRLVQQFPPEAFYAPPVEVIRQEAARESHGHFNLLHLVTMLRADVYLAGRDPLPAWGLSRKRRRSLGSVEGWVAPPEYVILQKLIYYRAGRSSRHLRDIAWILQVSESLIDFPLLEGKVDELGLSPEWDAARQAPLDL